MRCVAGAITAAVTTPDAPRQWEVVVFQDDDANAFALPGGKIGVHTGILKVAKNQDQLATVIGHEVAHVLAEHANERVSQQMVAGTLMEVGGSDDGPDAGRGTRHGRAGRRAAAVQPDAGERGRPARPRPDGERRLRPAREHQVLAEHGAARAAAGTPEFLSTHPSDQTRTGDLQGRIAQTMPLYEKAVAAGRRPKCG